MANAKRKPAETPKRSPGKSKFVFPKRDAPPVDNTYFDRLFSELQQQNYDSNVTTQDSKDSIPEAALNSNQSTSSANLTDTTEANREANRFENKNTRFKDRPKSKPSGIDVSGEPSKTKLRPSSVASLQTISPASDSADEHILAAPEQAITSYCKPETSSYVDQLKMKYRLSKGEANVLRYLLGATHDKGQGECYVIVPKLAEAVGMTTRGCQFILKSLRTRGFVVRAEEYDPANRLGIKIQVNLLSL